MDQKVKQHRFLKYFWLLQTPKTMTTVNKGRKQNVDTIQFKIFLENRKKFF
jgi:hypothetical protein